MEVVRVVPLSAVELCRRREFLQNSVAEPSFPSRKPRAAIFAQLARVHELQNFIMTGRSQHEIRNTYVSWSDILVRGAGDPGSADRAGFTGHDFRQGHFPKRSRTLRQLRSGRDGWKCRVRQSIRWLR